MLLDAAFNLVGGVYHGDTWPIPGLAGILLLRLDSAAALMSSRLVLCCWWRNVDVWLRAATAGCSPLLARRTGVAMSGCSRSCRRTESIAGWMVVMLLAGMTSIDVVGVAGLATNL